MRHRSELRDKKLGLLSRRLTKEERKGTVISAFAPRQRVWRAKLHVDGTVLEGEITMRKVQFHFKRFSQRHRKGLLNITLAAGMVVAVLIGAVSLEYWSGRAFDFFFVRWQGMSLESYRNLILVVAMLGWLLSHSSSSQVKHRHHFRP